MAKSHNFTILTLWSHKKHISLFYYSYNNIAMLQLTKYSTTYLSTKLYVAT